MSILVCINDPPKQKRYFHEEWPDLTKGLSIEEQDKQHNLSGGFALYEKDEDGWFHYASSAPEMSFNKSWIPMFESTLGVVLKHSNDTYHFGLSYKNLSDIDPFIEACQVNNHEIIASFVPIISYANKHQCGIYIAG